MIKKKKKMFNFNFYCVPLVIMKGKICCEATYVGTSSRHQNVIKLGIFLFFRNNQHTTVYSNFILAEEWAQAQDSSHR